MKEYTFSVLEKGVTGVCQRCGTQTDRLYKLKLTDGTKSKQLQLCPSCAEQFRAAVNRKNSAAKQESAPAPASAPAAPRTCPQCGSAVKGNAAFCGRCGTPMPAAAPAPGPAVCPDCGMENAPDMRFCQRCGKPLPQKGRPTAGNCPHCSAPLRPNLKFCTNCGKRLTPPATPEPEQVVCPTCGTVTGADRATCPACGGKLA